MTLLRLPKKARVFNIGKRRWQAKFKSKEFRFSRQTAFRLIMIARHHVISDVTHVQRLPPHWGTLYELTKIPAHELEAHLKNGRITPWMQQSDVVAMCHMALRHRRTKIYVDLYSTTLDEPAQMHPAALVFLSAPIARKLAVAWTICKGDESQWLDTAGITRRSRGNAWRTAQAYGLMASVALVVSPTTWPCATITTLARKPLLKIWRHRDKSSQ